MESTPDCAVTERDYKPAQLETMLAFAHDNLVDPYTFHLVTTVNTGNSPYAVAVLPGHGPDR
jgi:hypothetical protein